MALSCPHPPRNFHLNRMYYKKKGTKHVLFSKSTIIAGHILRHKMETLAGINEIFRNAHVKYAIYGEIREGQAKVS